MTFSSKISKGKKIVHFCNYSPLDSGIYPETRDLVYEELRRGYDALIVDHIAENRFRLDPAFHDDLFREGRVIGLEEDDRSQEADLICWHSWIPDRYMADTSKDLVMFLHAMPSHVFYNELYGGEQVLSFLKQADQRLPHCHYYITLWPSHKPYWENILKEKLVVSKPIIYCDCIHLKSDAYFDPGHLKLVVMDTWRGGKEPYYVINSVQIMMAKYHRGELPYKVTLDIYGQGTDKVQPVWHTIIREGFEQYFYFKGRDDPQNIFDSHDILLTQVGEIPTESRVIREGLLSGIPIVSGFPYDEWTDFKHDCRDIKGYADQILQCWNGMQDREKRENLYKRNRHMACEQFDIKKNAVSIFECYERIFQQSEIAEETGDGTGLKTEVAYPQREHCAATTGHIDYDQIKQLINDCKSEDCLETVLDKMQPANQYLTREEAIIRLLIDFRNQNKL